MIDLSRTKLVIFDLDGTLAESKSAIDARTADLLVRLLARTKVAIISGGGYPQFQAQVLSQMPASSDNLSNLLLMPTSGTRLMVWKGSWTEEYAEHLGPKEKEKIMIALNEALRSAGYTQPQTIYGPLIEDRGSQITFSACGQSAPGDIKSSWDPKRDKREKIATILRPKLPEYDIRIGGSTSIDITKRGINKAYGIRKLEERLGLHAEEIVFVGDALFYGGNDYPARATGVECIQVSGPTETCTLIETALNA